MKIMIELQNSQEWGQDSPFAQNTERIPSTFLFQGFGEAILPIWKMEG